MANAVATDRLAPPLRALERVQALKRRLRRIFALDGAASMAFGICGAAAVSFCLDYFLVLPAGMRLFFLAGGATALAWYAYRLVGRWLSRPIADEDVAVLVERAQPTLRQSLITAIELTRPGSEAAAWVSPAMIESVVRAVERDIDGVSFDAIFSLSRLRRKALLLCGALLVLVAAGVLDPQLGGIWFRRNLLLAAEAWPRSTELQVVSPAFPATVAVGDSLELTVRVVRGHPRAVVARTAEDGRPERVETLQSVSAGLHRRIFENIARPFWLRVEGGDDEIGPFRVDVKFRPRIDMQSIRLWCVFPAYSGLPRTPDGEPLRHGNLKVPTGTKVRYTMAADVPIAKAFFVFRPESEERPAGEAPAAASPAVAGEREGEGAATPWPDPGAVALPVSDGKTFSGDFLVSENGQYYFQLESAADFRSARPERFRVEAVPDRKPLVQIREPERITEEVSPEATVRIRATADDDYGIREGTVSGLYFAAAGKDGASRSFPLAGMDAVPAAKEREGEATVEVSRLDAAGKPPPGARFQYLALATDTGGNTGESQVHFLEVVSADDLLRTLGDQLLVVRDQLREVERRQASARKDLSELAERLSAGGKLGEEEARTLVRHQQDQQKVTEALKRADGDVAGILERSVRNKAGDEKWRSWLDGVRGDLGQLASGKSREIEESLQKLRKDAQASPQDSTRLAAVEAAQRDVERDIDALALRLSEFGDMNALIQMLREIRRRQTDLREETRMRAAGSPPADEAPEEPKK